MNIFPKRKFSLKWTLTHSLYLYFWKHPVFEDAEYHEDLNGSWYQQVDPFYRETHMDVVDRITVGPLDMLDFGGTIQVHFGKLQWCVDEPKYIRYPKWLIRMRRIASKLIPVKGNAYWEMQVGPWVIQWKHDHSPYRGQYKEFRVWKDPYWRR